MKKIFSTIAITAAALAFMPGMAFAADQLSTAATEYPIATNELIITFIGLVFGALAGVAGWAVFSLRNAAKKYLNINIDAKTREYLETALMSGLAWAENKAIERAHKIRQPSTKDQKIGQAADYVIERVPDALQHFGLDRHGIIQLIEARLKDGNHKDDEKAEDEEEIVAGGKT
tara:strand:+ start:1790 stop:2311 length:522 start_codon:yes stop_codon:yes gene_type:complete